MQDIVIINKICYTLWVAPKCEPEGQKVSRQEKI